MQKLSVLLLLIGLIFLGACSSNKDNGAEGGSEQEVYQRAVKLMQSGNWEAVIQTLQLLEEFFPFGTYAEQAQLELIFAYYRTSNYDAAIAAADRFIRLNPQHSNVDYAYYMRGVASFVNDSSYQAALINDTSNRDAGTAKLSFEYFTELLTKFPESPYGPDARKRMTYLRNTLARYEIHVANYYFKRGAFLAAANRGRFVVENMQTTPAVPDGLAVMAQAYHLLDLQDLADDTVAVLSKNFPDYPKLTQDGKFVYEYKVKRNRSWISYLTLGFFDKKQYVTFDTRRQYNSFYFDENNKNPLSVPAPRQL